MKHLTAKLALILLIITVIFTVNFLTVSAYENPAGVDYKTVIDYMSGEIKEQIGEKDPGLSLALVDDQKIVWTERFGLANLEANIQVTPDTLFYVGSISKLFTATAIMQLVEDGLIDLDKPLQTYLPDFAMKTRFPNAEPITIRSILTHHSGLPSELRQGHVSYDLDYNFGSILPQLKNEY